MAAQYWIRNMLEARGVPFEELHHSEVYTSQEVAQEEHVSGHCLAKVVAVMADGRPVELVLPASRHVKMNLLRPILGAGSIRLASEDEMASMFSDCETGTIPPLRHWKDVPVVMDRSLRTAGDIVFQAGTHTDAIRMTFKDWYELVAPQVASFSEPAEVAHA